MYDIQRLPRFMQFLFRFCLEHIYYTKVNSKTMWFVQVTCTATGTLYMRLIVTIVGIINKNVIINFLIITNKHVSDCKHAERHLKKLKQSILEKNKSTWCARGQAKVYTCETDVALAVRKPGSKYNHPRFRTSSVAPVARVERLAHPSYLCKIFIKQFKITPRKCLIETISLSQ